MAESIRAVVWLDMGGSSLSYDRPLFTGTLLFSGRRLSIAMAALRIHLRLLNPFAGLRQAWRAFRSRFTEQKLSQYPRPFELAQEIAVTLTKHGCKYTDVSVRWMEGRPGASGSRAKEIVEHELLMKEWF